MSNPDSKFEASEYLRNDEPWTGQILMREEAATRMAAYWRRAESGESITWHPERGPYSEREFQNMQAMLGMIEDDWTNDEYDR